MSTIQKQESLKKYALAEDCPITAAISKIGGKWKPVIIWVLMASPRRFGELHKLVPGIALKVLSRQLKELEADELIVRKAYPEVPPRVEYSLSNKGESLRNLMELLADWGRDQIIH